MKEWGIWYDEEKTKERPDSLFQISGGALRDKEGKNGFAYSLPGT